MRPFHRSYSTLTLRNVCRATRQQGRLLLTLGGTVVFLIMLLPIASCGKSAPRSEQAENPSHSAFRMESSAFREGETIPRKFTCEGGDISPALRWTAPPSGTRSFVLIAEDPDAPGGVWTHWIVFNLPAHEHEIPENVPKQEQVPGGGFQGLNSFGHIGYGGPCPPPGRPHHYFFRLYALDSVLSLKAGASRQQVLDAVKGHILAQTHLMGLFGR